MFIRIVRTTGSAEPEQRQAALRAWQENIEPVLKQQKGYLGAVILAAVGSGDGSSITYWQDEQALEASGAATQSLRDRSPQLTGRQVTEIDTFEITFMERMKPVSTPAFLRSNELISDLSKIDTGTAMVRDRVFPAVKGQPGFRALVSAVNRRTGRTLVSTTWDSMEDLERSEAAVVDLREESARATGATGVKVEKWEAIYAEVPAQAGVLPT